MSRKPPHTGRTDGDEYASTCAAHGNFSGYSFAKSDVLSKTRRGYRKEKIAVFKKAHFPAVAGSDALTKMR